MPSPMRRRQRLHGAGFDDDPRAARAARLVVARMTDQPLVESRLAAVEPVEEVLTGQQLRTGVGH